MLLFTVCGIYLRKELDEAVSASGYWIFIRSVVRLIFMVFDKCMTIFINKYLLRWPEFYIFLLLVFFSVDGTIFSIIFLYDHFAKHYFKKYQLHFNAFRIILFCGSSHNEKLKMSH